MADNSDVNTYLDELRRVEEGLHRYESDRDAMVREARRQGASWGQIGEALGIAKQSAWERFRSVDPTTTEEAV